MPEAQVDIRMSAKDAEIVSAWQRQQTSLSEFEGSLSRVAKKSKGWTDEMKEGFKGMGDSLVGSLVGFEAIRKGADFLVESYREQVKELTEVVAKQRESREELTHMLTLGGKLRDAPIIEKGLGEITTATRDEKQAAYKAVAEAAPDLSAERQLGLIRQTAPLAEAAGTEGMAGISRLSAKLQKTAPGRSGFDVANLANVATHEGGARAGELSDPGAMRALEILTKSGGMSMERGLAFETESLNSELGMKGVEKIADSLVENKELKQHPHSREDGAFNKFYREKDAQKRLQMLQRDAMTRTAVLGGKEAQQMGLLDPKSIDAREARLRGSHEGAGSIAADVEENEKQHPIDASRRRSQLGIGRAKVKHAKESGEELYEAGSEENEQAFLESHGGGPLQTARLRAGQALRRVLHETVGGFDYNATIRMRKEQQEERTKQRSIAEFRRQGLTPPPELTTTPEMIQDAQRSGRISGGDAETLRQRPEDLAPPGGRSLQEETNELLRKQHEILLRIAEKPQTVAVNVETGRGAGTRFDATQRGEKSPSAALGMNS